MVSVVRAFLLQADSGQVDLPFSFRFRAVQVRVGAVPFLISLTVFCHLQGQLFFFLRGGRALQFDACFPCQFADG